MKKILTVLMMMFTMSLSAQNFVAREVFTDSITTYTYQIKSIVYPVYKSRSGAFYIWKISAKTNKRYKYYLPKEIQIKMGRIYKR